MLRKIISSLTIMTMLGALMLSPALAGDFYTDEWLSGWEYEIKDLGYEGKHIFLDKYTGTEADISIGGKATVNGVDYPVCISMKDGGGYGHYRTALNTSDAIRQVTFYSVDGTPVKPEISYRLDDFFYGMENLEGINFRGDFKTDGVVQAPRMFYGCSSLKYVDVDNLDLSRCSVFKEMFAHCESLNRVTASCPRASNMEDMFRDCYGLTEVTLAGQGCKPWKVRCMFSGCRSLDTVNLTDMDFSEVNDFSYMFFDCEYLKSLDMGAFDFSSATDVSNMFSSCYSLEQVNFEDTAWGESRPDASRMFYRCEGLHEITVPGNFDPSSADEIFYVPFSKESIIRIKGSPSQGFCDLVFPGLEESNRYIGQVKLRSRVELEGKELEAGLFTIDYKNSRHSIREEVIPAENAVDLTVPVYKPGTNTFSIEELYNVDESVLYHRYLPIEYVDAVSCENPRISKTVEIIRNTDGSISVIE